MIQSQRMVHVCPLGIKNSITEATFEKLQNQTFWIKTLFLTFFDN